MKKKKTSLIKIQFDKMFCHEQYVGTNNNIQTCQYTFGGNFSVEILIAKEGRRECYFK